MRKICPLEHHVSLWVLSVLLLNLIGTKDASATIVYTVDHPITTQAKCWIHAVEEAGDYQIGMAWIEVKSGNKVPVEVFVNSNRVKVLYAPVGEVTRFETRLEGLAVGDEIRVKVTPSESAYRIGYQIAFATPTFDGLPVFNVAGYGAAGDGTTDDRTAIRKAVDAAIAAGGGIVRFDGTKTYRVIGDKSPNIENLFDLVGVGGIKIEGNGANLVLYPPDRLAYIDNSENIQVDGFTVDYDPLPYYQGTIDAIDVANLTVDITVPDRYEVPLVGPNTLPAGWPFFTYTFVPDSPGARTGTGRHLYIDSTERIEDQARKIRLHARSNMTPALQHAVDRGATEIIVPHRDYGHRGVFSLSVRRSSRVTVSNVLFHLLPHLGIQPAENVGPVTFSNVDLLVKDPGTELFFSWRGAYSVTGHNRWGFLIEDGDWNGSAMYDDLLAFYTRTQDVMGVDGQTLDLKFNIEVHAGLFRPGDWISVWTEDQTRLRGMSRIARVGAERADHTFDVTLESLPPGTRVNDVAINEELYNRDTLVRNCTNRDVGASNSSTRLRTGGHFLNCDFEDVNIYTEFDRTFHSVRARNLVLENCTIRPTDHGRILLYRAIHPKIIGCTLDNIFVLIGGDTDSAWLQGNSWINMTGNIVKMTGDSEAWIFGASSRNGSAEDLSNWVKTDDPSTIHFSAPPAKSSVAIE